MRSIMFAALASAMLVGGTAVEARAANRIQFDNLSACVPDVAKSAKFLRDVFGWRAASLAAKPHVDGEGKETVGEVEWIDADEFKLQLKRLPDRNSGGHCSNGVYSSITFATPDMPKLPTDFHRLGLKPVRAGTEASPGLLELSWPRTTTTGTSVGLKADGDGDAGRQTNVGRVTAPKVDRIALIVRDVEKTASFYTKILGLRRNPESVILNGKTNKQSGGIRAVFIDANGVWLALVQPVGPGPLNAYLDRYGDGTIAELIIEVPRIADFYDLMVSRNMTLVDTRGEPVDPKVKAHILQPYGDKIAYFPSEATGGLTIEIVERGPPATSLLERRDRGWRRSNEAAVR